MLKFSDGQKFDTSGELRISRRSDGLYVIGKGMLIPVNSREEASEIISDMLSKSECKNAWHEKGGPVHCPDCGVSEIEDDTW